MIDTQLLLLEGLPSTGKTTNARFIHIQLERNGINAKWIHEVAMPHPVLFFDEAGLTHDEFDKFILKYPNAADILNKIAIFKESTVGIHLPEIEWYYKDEIGEDVYKALLEYDVWKFPLEKYKKFASEKWKYFTDKALQKRGEVYIIDSAIFQFQIFSFLFKNRPYEELQSFIDQIIDIIQPLNPRLIYLYRENTEATIDYLENDRGTSYLEYLWNRDKAQPYYADKPPGAESFKRFLRDYGKMADMLFDSFPTDKIALEISDGNWNSRENDMLSFLNVNRVPSPDALTKNGVYKNEEFGFVIRVDGLSFIDPTGQTRKLFPKSHNEFYVDWLPTVLRFENNENNEINGNNENSKIIISGTQICERWTTTGMIYTKISSNTNNDASNDTNNDASINPSINYR